MIECIKTDIEVDKREEEEGVLANLHPLAGSPLTAREITGQTGPTLCQLIYHGSSMVQQVGRSHNIAIPTCGGPFLHRYTLPPPSDWSAMSASAPTFQPPPKPWEQHPNAEAGPSSRPDVSNNITTITSDRVPELPDRPGEMGGMTCESIWRRGGIEGKADGLMG